MFLRAMAIALVLLAGAVTIGLVQLNHRELFPLLGKAAEPWLTPANTATPNAATRPDAKSALPAHQYRVNGKMHELPLAVRGWLGGVRITLSMKDAAASDVAAELSRQGRRELNIGMGDAAKLVSLDVQNAPFWHALMAFCETGGWGFTVYSQPGYPIGIETDPTGAMTTSWAVAGPLLFGWRGGDANSLYLEIEPSSSAFFREPMVNPEFSLQLADGETHPWMAAKEMQDGRGGRAWELGPELPGELRSLSVSIPLAGLIDSHSITAPWEPDRTHSTDQVLLLLEAVETTSQEVRDPVDPFQTANLFRHTAKFRLRHPAGLIFDQMNAGRSVAPAEQAQLEVFPEGGVLNAHAVWLIGKDGTRMEGRIDGGSGMNSPWHGYGFEAVFETPDPIFAPAELGIAFAEGFDPAEVAFRLSDLQ